MKKCFLSCLILTVFCIFINCDKPQATGQATGRIDVLKDPQQIAVEQDTSIKWSVKRGEFTISLVDKYTLAGIVVGKGSFSMGWEALLAPVDLTFIWGELTESEVRECITFTHKGRWYFYRYTEKCPVTNKYIIEHSSNNHIIPANKNILLAVKSIRYGTPVILNGYLVTVTGIYKKKKYWWYSSRTRTDSGQNSCELIYVTRVRIGNDIYE